MIYISLAGFFGMGKRNGKEMAIVHTHERRLWELRHYGMHVLDYVGICTHMIMDGAYGSKRILISY